MKKRIGLFVINCLLFSSIFSTEFRSPWLSERGPLRYKFENGKPDKYTVDIYSAGHRREAHKAFLKHGTDTKPLTALFFNKADVPLVEIFPNSTMNTNAQHYNPFMKLMKIYPRATYYEWGVNLGCRFEHPVWANKGRLGFRLNIPFRLIEIERENIVDRSDDPVEDFILTKLVQVETGANSDTGVNVMASAYNLGFLSTLFQNPQKNAAVDFSTKGVARIFGTDIAQPWLLGSVADEDIPGDFKIPDAGIIYTHEDTGRPKDPASSVGPGAAAAPMHWAFNQGAAVNDAEPLDRGDHAISDGVAAGVEPIGIPLNGIVDLVQPFGDATQSHQNVFREVAFFTKYTDDAVPGGAGTATDYSALLTDAQKTQRDKMWLILGYENGSLTAGATNIKAGIDNAIKEYTENPYEWLLNKGGYELETRRLSGFGDIDLDMFYEHIFSNHWIGECMVGFRMPTGSDDDFSGNPYKVHLGNGEHWELKLGGMMAWRPLSWLNVKLDTYFSWVLEATEKRCAVFEGSKIKNMGPAVDADVSWEYFVGRLDFNMFHRKTSHISSTIGYELYYKTTDKISFRKSKMTTWYGVHYSPAVNDTNPNLEYNLDNKLARANTESIGHKIRTEIRCQLDEFVELFAGGSYTFAGQNLARETDLHLGFNVRFW